MIESTIVDSLYKKPENSIRISNINANYTKIDQLQKVIHATLKTQKPIGIFSHTLDDNRML